MQAPTEVVFFLLLIGLWVIMVGSDPVVFPSRHPVVLVDAVTTGPSVADTMVPIPVPGPLGEVGGLFLRDGAVALVRQVGRGSRTLSPLFTFYRFIWIVIMFLDVGWMARFIMIPLAYGMFSFPFLY